MPHPKMGSRCSVALTVAVAHLLLGSWQASPRRAAAAFGPAMWEWTSHMLSVLKPLHQSTLSLLVPKWLILWLLWYGPLCPDNRGGYLILYFS